MSSIMYTSKNILLKDINKYFYFPYNFMMMVFNY